MKIDTLIRKSLFLLVFVAGSGKASAQIRLALYGGIHSATVIEKNSIPGWDTSTQKYYSSRTGFQIGFLGEIPIGKKGFYFQPGMTYISKGRQFEKSYDSLTASVSDTLYTQSKLNLGYMEIPLYLTYKIPLSANHKNSFFLSAGPYFAFFFNGTMDLQNRLASSNKFNQESVDLNPGNGPDQYKTLDIGLTAKAGFEFGNVMISGYFSQGLKSFYTAGYDGSFHHQLVGATLGIWLNKPVPVAKPEKDSDLDSIPDSEDACPLQPGPVRWKGCPIPDTDLDGINDEEDSCKTLAGTIKYHGCPIPDTDADGINDEEDSCKTLPGIRKYHGCPIPDRDGDGVNDEEDHCPDLSGSLENFGCPIEKKPIPEKKTFDAKKVMFKPSSSNLTRNSYKELDALVYILKANPEVRLTIEGHTDNTGSAAFNDRLSQKRADAVRQYLIRKGIDGSRIHSVGYGAGHPAAGNQSRQGKAQNRRVEFKFE